MKEITILTTTGGKAILYSTDEQTEELKKNLEKGGGSLMSSTESAFSWINIRNVVQVEAKEHVEKKEDPKEEAEEEKQK